MVKPNIGVTKVHVTIPPDELYSTDFIVAPLLLLIANILCVTGSNPFGGTLIIASVIALPSIFASIDPVESCNPVSGFTMTKSGSTV